MTGDRAFSLALAMDAEQRGLKLPTSPDLYAHSVAREKCDKIFCTNVTNFFLYDCKYRIVFTA